MSVFDKLPFKGLAEKALGGIGVKVPLVGKIISFANQIVCGLAALLLVIIITGAAGGEPKNISTLLAYWEKGKDPNFKTINSIMKKTNPNAFAKAVTKTGLKQSYTKYTAASVRLAVELASIKQREELVNQLTVKIPLMPSPPEHDFSYELNKEGNGIIIKEYTGGNVFLNIPSKIEGYPVVQIGNGNDGIKPSLVFVFIPEGVTSIESGAFPPIHNMSLDFNKKHVSSEINSYFLQIMFPSTLTHLGGGNFTATLLMNVDLSKTQLKEISDSLFWNLDYLKTVKLPDSIEKIGRSAFFQNLMLTDINLPANIKVIDESAFKDCKELNNLIISDSTSQIKFLKSWSGAVSAFEGCGKLPIKTRQRLQELGYKDEF